MRQLAGLPAYVGLYASLLPRLVPAGTSLTAGRAAVVGVLVNVVSHPLLWFVLQPALDRTGATTVVVVLVAESAVWLLEAGLVRAAELGPPVRCGKLRGAAPESEWREPTSASTDP